MYVPLLDQVSLMAGSKSSSKTPLLTVLLLAPPLPPPLFLLVPRQPALGFANGWNYVVCYGITVPVELVAVAIVIDYWPRAAAIAQAVWITPFFAAIMIVNLLGARWYGEMESIASAIKILAIVGLVILGIAIDCGAGPETDGYQGFTKWTVCRTKIPFFPLSPSLLFLYSSNYLFLPSSHSHVTPSSIVFPFLSRNHAGSLVAHVWTRIIR